MRLACLALLLGVASPAGAADPFQEADSFCHARAAAVGFWHYYRPDLDGDGRADLLFEALEQGPGGGPTQLRVFLSEEGGYRQIGRVLSNRPPAIDGSQSPPRLLLLRRVSPARIRLGAYEVRGRRIHRLPSRTIYAERSDLQLQHLDHGVVTCDAQAKPAVQIIPPSSFNCGTGVSDAEMEQRIVAHRRRTKRTADLLRVSRLWLRQFESRP